MPLSPVAAAAVLSALFLGEAAAQFTWASCADLPSSITSDTIVIFTSGEITCSTNTQVLVTSGASVEISSEKATTKLHNVKFELQDGSSFLSSVPHLEWTSVETESATSVDQAVGGAAMRVNAGTSATFAEDVTFSGCSLPEEDLAAGSGSAVVNMGTLVFEKTATFKDTVDGGALYASGQITFMGDALFENNTNIHGGSGNAYGGAIYVDDTGEVAFEGAASFIDNEVAATDAGYGGGGAAIYSDSSAESPMLFSGPALFSGNKGFRGTFGVRGGQSVVFESLATFEDNAMEPTLESDSSIGGAMWASAPVEFRAGVTATGNSANDGGAFYFEGFAEITMSSPVTIADNEARSTGGAVWSNGRALTIPAEAQISGNAAAFCPGINFETDPLTDETETVTLGDITYTDADEDLCYLGSRSSSSSSISNSNSNNSTDSGGIGEGDIIEDSDCAVYSATAPTLNGYPTLTVDSYEVESWDLAEFSSLSSQDGFSMSCPVQLIVYVTGGGELTITSSAASSTLENIRFEVVGFSHVILDVPELTMTGIYQSKVGGAFFVEAGSSMDVMNDITFQGNSLAFEYDDNQDFNFPWRGGAAMYSAGDVTFYGEVNIVGNGQYEVSLPGEEPANEDGGALANYGTMEFMKKGTFKDNFNANGGNGGAVANYGDLSFNVRAIFQNNSVGVAYTDDGQPFGGRGGALFNGGGTTVLKGQAFFKKNVGGLGGCAVASRGSTENGLFDDDDGATTGSGTNKITFESKAKFKDNYCDGGYPDIYADRDDRDEYPDTNDENKGGGALLAYGDTTVEFLDTAVFKRNEGVNGGAIVNAATISFVSETKLFIQDNTAATAAIAETLLGDYDPNDFEGFAACPSVYNHDEGTVQIGAESFAGGGSSAGSLCEYTSG